MKKVVVSLSGGLDSATLLATAIAEGNEVQAVGFLYGSNHNRWEIQSATKLAEHYKIPFELIDVQRVFMGFKSNLLGGTIPEGHYEDESMKLTVVPGRNIIFASILAGYACSQEIEEVWLGIHAGDHAIYPDCRPDFYNNMARAVHAGTDGGVKLESPFLFLTKEHIVKRGLELGVPYELTRTCYKSQQLACGKCGSCVERLEAFEKNGVIDPIEYEK
jgi:7-cyano-7-deazaguanine synthase